MADVTFDNAKKITDFEKFQSKDFKTERELCNYIEENIKLFCRDVLEIEYMGHEREYVICEDRRINKKHKARVDFRFKNNDGDIYVECKNPTHVYSESNGALNQILAYSCVADFYQRKVSRLILLTTKYNVILGATIRKFNLPIEVFVFSKDHVLKMMNDDRR